MGIDISQLHADACLFNEAFYALLTGVSVEKRREAGFNNVKASLAVVEGVNHTQDPILGNAHLNGLKAGYEKLKLVPSNNEVDYEPKILRERVNRL